MNKRQSYYEKLVKILHNCIINIDNKDIIRFITKHSNLPGPRGNLELAFAFSDVITESLEKNKDQLWQLCNDLCSITVDEAPVNSPFELVSFCGTLGIGSLGSKHTSLFNIALCKLKILANDPRWRMREAVAMALQRLANSRSLETLNELTNWIVYGKFLELRAVAAALADPAILKDEQVAAQALMMHQKIMENLVLQVDRKSETFRTLRKGLGYTWSVVIQANPEKGFNVLAEMAKSEDRDIQWIVRENLKKNRLIKNFAEQVELIKSLLN